MLISIKRKRLFALVQDINQRLLKGRFFYVFLLVVFVEQVLSIRFSYWIDLHVIDGDLPDSLPNIIPGTYISFLYYQ